MFEKYFVTAPVAVALKEAGFDEPCIAAREYYSDSNGNYQEELHVAYISHPPEISIYSDKIQKLMVRKPGLFKDLRLNSQFPTWLYAAPLYAQVFEWFLKKGLYLHPYLLNGPINIAFKEKWGVNIFNPAGSLEWPVVPFQPDPNKFEDDRQTYIHADKRDAYEQAIIAAIKLLPNESKKEM